MRLGFSSDRPMFALHAHQGRSGEGPFDELDLVSITLPSAVRTGMSSKDG